MRIAYVCADPGVPVFGRKGASVHVQEIIRALLERGDEVTLFATRFGGEVPEGLGGVRVHPLPGIPKGDLGARERAALEANAGLRAALLRAGPFDLLYERYSLWSEAGVAYAAARGVPSVLEVNAPLIEEQAEHRGLHHRDLAEGVARRAFGAASLLVAVSEGVAAYLRGFPEAAGRVAVVPNGVNVRRFRPGLPPERVFEPGAFVVAFVGTLKPWHGLPTLVEAFARLHEQHPEARLLVVGDGPERAGLEADLAARGLLSVAHLTGAVDPERVPALLAGCDAAVAPYPARDDLYFSPLKVYEYMAMGLPVVASRLGQLEEALTDGVDALLCPPGDADAFAAALARPLRDPALRTRLGRAARRAAEARSWDAVAARILDLALRREVAA